MNISLKKIVLTAAIFYSLVLSTWSKPVVAHELETDVGIEEPHGRHFAKMARFLQLSDEQKQQLKQSREAAKAEKQALDSEFAQFRAQAKLLAQAKEFDEQAFNNLYLSYQDTFAKMALARAKHKHQMAQILTEEQREKAEQMHHRKRGAHQKAED